MNKMRDSKSGKVYFSADRQGNGTKMQRTIFAEVFYCMAMTAMAKATKEQQYLV